MSAQISFEQDARLAEELLRLLAREQTKLVRASIEELESLLEEKAQLIQRMSTTAQQRYDLLTQNGLPGNESGMARWVHSQKSSKLEESWRMFQTTLNQAKEINRVNGLLINKHFNRNQELLNLMQGNQSSVSLYGANGQATSGSFFRGSLAA